MLILRIIKHLPRNKKALLKYPIYAQPLW
jgi:hypothetical protein